MPHPDTLFQTARDLHLNGRFADAHAAYHALLALQPNHAEAWHSLGILTAQAGRPADALEPLRRALELQPDNPTYHFNLAYTHQTLGDHAAAIPEFLAALRLQPTLAAAHFSLAISQAALHQPQAAIAAYRQAIVCDPKHAAALCNLAVLLHDAADYTAAIDAARQALALNPNFVEARFNLARSLQARSQPRDIDEAITAYRNVTRLAPTLAAAHHHLANLLQDTARLDEALSAYQAALQLDPHQAQLHNNYGQALFASEGGARLDDALASYARALALNPNLPQAHNNRAIALAAAARHDEARAAHRHALALQPDDPAIHSNLILALHYHPATTSADILEECRRWNHHHAAPLRHLIRPYDNDRHPDRPLRIGYISPDFRDHPVAYNLLPLFAAHDRAQFPIFCYSNTRLPPDSITRLLQSHAHTWRDIAALSPDQAADLIRADRIDILIDLALHSAHGNLLTLARKPAPLQIAFAGYPGITGLDTVDYRLTDPHLDPPATPPSLSPQSSVLPPPPETPLRLPDTFWCFDPHSDLPITPLPADSSGTITFGCLNTTRKLNDSILPLWSAILQAIPHSRLLLQAPPGQTRDRIRSFFEAIAPDRLIFTPRLPRPAYLQLYHQIDIGLDTIPYNGHTTSLDAYWMGIPVITLLGPTLVGRAGYSQLMNLGLPDLIARTPKDYIAIAAALAADRPRLAALRQSLRPRLQASPLMDGPRFARALESACRQMWTDWCAH